MTTRPHLEPRVLIVAEHASARFGGEAALPLHYFRVLEKRRHPVHLLIHARTRDELVELYGAHPRIHYVEDTALHVAMWRLGRRLPHRIAYMTTGFVSRIATQIAQRRIAKRLVRSEGIDIVHQPIPVSPREPSALFGLGAPVVIGPMNGNMSYPPGFRMAGAVESLMVAAGRLASRTMNHILPGKHRAAALLVANKRTLDALPNDGSVPIFDMVENGVDRDLFEASDPTSPRSTSPPRFVFMGRLVDWKRVDLLLQAFASAKTTQPMVLEIIGDGPEREPLISLAETLGLSMASADAAAQLVFSGWMTQQACARRLESARALVLPSVYECGGAVVLEAMAMGRAVIATAWGGPLDYLTEASGILIRPTSEEDLVEGLRAAMVDLAENPARAECLGAHGAEDVARRHDWEVKVDAMLDVYRAHRRRT